ncbi:MAG: hypothetical protein V4714_02740, partial [Bacteroidota bacterium]
NLVNWSLADDIPSADPLDTIKGGTVTLNGAGSPIKNWKIDAGNMGIDAEKTEDVLLLMKYIIK